VVLHRSVFRITLLNFLKGKFSIKPNTSANISRKGIEGGNDNIDGPN
jgi:hypothetical protein